jgi:hypothetical protein
MKNCIAEVKCKCIFLSCFSYCASSSFPSNSQSLCAAQSFKYYSYSESKEGLEMASRREELNHLI